MLESSVNLVHRSLLPFLPLLSCSRSRHLQDLPSISFYHKDSNPWYHENSSLAGLELASQRRYKSVSSILLKHFTRSGSFHMKTIQTMNSIMRTSLCLHVEVMLVWFVFPLSLFFSTNHSRYSRYL